MDTASNSCEARKESGIHVLVCGSYAPSQAAAAFYAAAGSSSVFCLKKEEAAKWNEALGEEDFVLAHSQGEVVKARPTLIADEPKVAELADAVILSVPRKERLEYVTAVAPFLKKDTVVVFMEARPGDDLALRAQVAEACSLAVVGCDNQLWEQCVVLEWGRKATLPSRTRLNAVGLSIPLMTAKVFEVLQHVLSAFPPDVHYCDSFLSLNLRHPLGVLHPGLVYGRWCPEQWNGRPVPAMPLYYQEIDDFAEGVLSSLSNEVQAIRQRLQELFPSTSFEDACTLKQWLVQNHEGQLCEASTLHECIKGSNGGSTVTHIGKECEGMYMPDFEAPRLATNLRNGLCFNKGLGELLGVAMPTTDKVICWAQDVLGLRLMVDGRLCGDDLHQTMAPQAFGICDLPSFANAAGLEAPIAAWKAQEQLLAASTARGQALGVETSFEGRASLRFVETLAQGGYGQVNLFQHEHSGQLFAGKKSLQKHADRSIIREADALRRLQHPHIIKFSGLCVEADGRPMAIYQFYEGGDLATRMKRPVQEALFNKWIANTASAVAYLHGEKVLHRDIKPLNLYLGPSEELYLGDFGECRKLSPYETKVMTKAGTTAFSSPEALQGQGYLYPADIWAMGKTFYLVQRFAGLEPSILVEKMLDKCPDTRPSAQDTFEEADKAYKASEARGRQPRIAKALEACPGQRPSAQEVLPAASHEARGAAQVRAAYYLKPPTASAPMPGVTITNTRRVVHVRPSYTQVDADGSRSSQAALPRLLGHASPLGHKSTKPVPSLHHPPPVSDTSSSDGETSCSEVDDGSPTGHRCELLWSMFPSWLVTFCR